MKKRGTLPLSGRIAGITIAIAMTMAGQTPSKTSFSAYFGGSHEDFVRRIATDSAGRIYVVGTTRSADFPTQQGLGIPGPFQRECSVGGGIFPLRYPCPDLTGFFAVVDVRGRTVLRSTFLDGAVDVATDTNGGVYVGGTLNPTRMAATAGAWQTKPLTATRTGFVAKFRIDGTLVWLTYINADVTAIGVDGSGGVIAAATVKADYGWTPTASAFQKTLNGASDVGLVKLTADGTGAAWVGLLGGAGEESVTRVRVDRAGLTYLLGSTNSTDLPVTANAIDKTGAGFLARVSADGAALNYLTYFSKNTIRDFAIAPSGAVWLGGSAEQQAYVARMEAPGQPLQVQVTVPGSAIAAIGVDPVGNAYAVGTTDSRKLPVTADAPQRFPHGGTSDRTDVFRNTFFDATNDSFVMKVGSDGRIAAVTYLGGNNIDNATAVAVLDTNRVAAAGNTRSSDWQLDGGTALAGGLRSNYVKGNCLEGRTGPNGPRDVQTVARPCDDAFITVFDLVPGTSNVGLYNAASGTAMPLAPGTIVSLFGEGLGPATGTSFTLTNKTVPTQTGGTQVLFDGVAGPVLYAQAGQVNAIVPFGVAGKESVKVEVEYGGKRVDAGLWRVAATAPALFTYDSSGAGGVAALNQDSKVNTATNAAAKGTIVSFFATGGGVMEPAATDGSTDATGKPVKPVRVWIQQVERSGFRLDTGFVPMEILYAGQAPGLVAGVLQINARIPDVAVTGAAVPVVLDIGGAGPVTATVAVK